MKELITAALLAAAVLLATVGTTASTYSTARAADANRCKDGRALLKTNRGARCVERCPEGYARVRSASGRRCLRFPPRRPKAAFARLMEHAQFHYLKRIHHRDGSYTQREYWMDMCPRGRWQRHRESSAPLNGEHHIYSSRDDVGTWKVTAAVFGRLKRRDGPGYVFRAEADLAWLSSDPEDQSTDQLRVNVLDTDADLSDATEAFIDVQRVQRAANKADC